MVTKLKTISQLAGLALVCLALCSCVSGAYLKPVSVYLDGGIHGGESPCNLKPDQHLQITFCQSQTVWHLADTGGLTEVKSVKNWSVPEYNLIHTAIIGQTDYELFTLARKTPGDGVVICTSWDILRGTNAFKIKYSVK